MKITEVVEALVTIVTLMSTALILWKSRKTLPKEVAQEDANAAKTYAEIADMAGKQVKDALQRIAGLEETAILLEARIDELQDVLTKRDVCIDTLTADIKRRDADIQRRDALIQEWARGIKILLTQLVQAKITPAWTPEELEFSSSE